MVGGLPNALLAAPNPPPPLPNPLENAMVVCKEQSDPRILALISFKIISINLSKRRDNGTPRSREFRSSRDPTYASHLFFRPGCASTPSHGVCFPLESWFRGAYFRLSELTRTPQGPSLPNPGRAPVRVSHDSRAKDPAAEFTRNPHAVACFATRLARSRR